MSNTFFIADLHLGHKAIITFDGCKPFRPFATIEEHDQEIIRRWNSVVGMNDKVYLLGDFCFGKHNLDKAGELNGHKYLIMGNHDSYASQDYLIYFNKLFGAIEYKRAILTHIPVHPIQFDRYAMNIHGHLHDKSIADRRYFNVSCEQCNLTPVPYEIIWERQKEIEHV